MPVMQPQNLDFFSCIAREGDYPEHAVHVVIKVTGTYGEDLAWCLYQAGRCVSMVNPTRIKAFGQSELQRTKNTHRVDAQIWRIEHGIRCHFEQYPRSQAPAGVADVPPWHW
jgi:transposase